MAEVVRSPIGCTTEDPKPDKFFKWCAKNKVIWDKCTMSMSNTTGRCVVAKQHINKDEVVVEVADDAVLMAENCQIQELLAEEGLVKPAEDALLEVQGLIIAVMYEKALGKKSRWEPYLSYLPSDMSHMPIYWTEAELSELRGTAAYDKMVGRVQHPADAPTRMSQLFDELVLPLVQAHGAVAKVLLGGSTPADTSLEDARQQLWQSYRWATAAVASYSFVLGDSQYQGMVPVWDLLNHITGRANVRLHHDAQREVLQMIATEDIPAGAEVVNCYGQLSNAELLRGYGYVEQHNSIQYVHVPAQFLIRAAAGAGSSSSSSKPAAAIGEGTATDPQGEMERNMKAAKAGVKSGEQEAAWTVEDEKADEADSATEDDQTDEASDDVADSDDGDASSEEGGSCGDSDDEPDWELEDDEEQQQQQPVPTFDKAVQQIPQWEDKWQLCFSMRLLPKNNVLQVPAGGLAALPQQLLPVLLLLLAGAGDCEQVAAAAAAATSKAAAMATAAAVATAGGGKGKKGGKQGKKQKTGARGSAAAATAAAGEDAGSAAAAVAAAVSEELALLGGLQFCAAGDLLSALQLLVALMQSRYSCSLAEDEVQLARLAELPAKLAAAVIARSSEKRVLQQLAEELQAAGIEQQLMQQAKQALQQSLMQLAKESAAGAAGSASQAGDGCCHVAGCPHDHQHHHDQQHAKKAHKQLSVQQQHQDGREAHQGSRSHGGRKRKQHRQDEEEEEDEEKEQEQVGQERSKPNQPKTRAKAAAPAAAGRAGTAGEGQKASQQQAGEAGEQPDGGFAFNFKM